jgi:ABC-type glycerol-3-phosphate transport system permease component
MSDVARTPVGEPGDPAVRSGAVTAVSTANFILGGLLIAADLLLLVFSRVLQARLHLGDPLFDLLGLYVAGLAAFVVLSLGLAMIAAGIGIRRRRRWGRDLGLILAVIFGLFAAMSAVPLLRLMHAPDLLTLSSLIGLLLGGGYCAFSSLILLNRKFAAEFSSAAREVSPVSQSR